MLFLKLASRVVWFLLLSVLGLAPFPKSCGTASIRSRAAQPARCRRRKAIKRRKRMERSGAGVLFEIFVIPIVTQIAVYCSPH
jgi:hypothetical protein